MRGTWLLSSLVRHAAVTHLYRWDRKKQSRLDIKGISRYIFTHRVHSEEINSIADVLQISENDLLIFCVYTFYENIWIFFYFVPDIVFESDGKIMIAEFLSVK